MENSITIQEVNLWCFDEEKNSDKLYGLYIWAADATGEKYDVVLENSRRGSQMSFNVLKEGVSKEEATRKFQQLIREKLAKGYKPIAEKVQEVKKGQIPPVLAEVA
jgi:predicted DNA-binding WGR domain protein